MPQSQLRGECQDSRSRHHHPISSARGDPRSARGWVPAHIKQQYACCLLGRWMRLSLLFDSNPDAIFGAHLYLRPTVMGAEQKTIQVFAFVVLKPTQGSGFFISVPKPARAAKKTYFSLAALRRLHESSPQRPRIMTKLGVVCFTESRVLAVKFEGRRRSMSRGLARDVGVWPVSV